MTSQLIVCKNEHLGGLDASGAYVVVNHIVKHHGAIQLFVFNVKAHTMMSVKKLIRFFMIEYKSQLVSHTTALPLSN